ncbi:MAG: hydrogenase [Coriobacteriaceae bacterium]|nr:hydrogenase [Coriobacteriaceae bacterium]
MVKEEDSALYALLDSRGVSRRDFLKYCGSVAALLGLSELAAPQIAAAVEKAGKLTPTLWLAEGLCTGCTESMAQVDTPDVPAIVLDYLSVNYWETVMAAAGEAAEKNIADTVKAGGYLVVVEGSVMKGFGGNALRIAGKPALEELETVCKGAAAVVAVGSCAVDGGWVRATPNPADATGVSMFLKEKGIATPVVNLPTCPVNPEWVVAVLVSYLLLGKLPELDDIGRPKLIFGQTIHDNCPRRGHFENSEFVEVFGSAEEAMGYCLYKLGCKGPQTLTNCPIVRWNRRTSWCVEAGSPCIGCGNLNWVDVGAPFFERSAAVNVPGVGGVSPDAIGIGLGAVAAGGLLIHGIAQTATGRMGHGAPVEEKKGGEA